MSDIFLEKFRSLVPLYLDEPWQESDGLPLDELNEVLAEHPFPVPLALREFLQALGGCEELMEAYHFFWDPEELEAQDGFLCFLEDEEEQYTWGMKLDQLDVPDPIVWRRNNARGTWTSEDGTFSEFVLDLLDFSFSEDD
jgi:hypothetical protein